MKIRFWSLFALIMTLCLMLAACTSNNEDESATMVDTSPVAVAELETAPADVVAKPPVVATPEETPTLASIDAPKPTDSGTPLDVDVSIDTNAGIDVGIDVAPEGIFARAAAALQALESYRFTTAFLFTGQDDGVIESGSIELSGEIMDATRKHFTWRSLEDNEQFEIIQIEDDAWIYSDEEWEPVPALVADAMAGAVLVFAPSAVWDGLFGGMEANSTYVGPDTVDGIPAYHYTSTYHQWATVWQGEVLDATGDVWIAEAGYPLRYEFTATAADENGDRGTVSWTMHLTDAGANIVIEPPSSFTAPSM